MKKIKEWLTGKQGGTDFIVLLLVAAIFICGCFGVFTFNNDIAPTPEVYQETSLAPSENFTTVGGLVIPNGYIDTSLDGDIVHGAFTFEITTSNVKIRVQEYEDLLAQAWRIIASQNATINYLLEHPQTVEAGE